MKAPKAPPLEPRRTSEFSSELRDRAQAWIPSWGLADGEGDFGRALLQIAARFNSEVAERLDGAGDKMRRGFLDWLGVRGKAARPARLPVVFELADAARAPVLADAAVRMEADAGGTPVIFETDTPVRILPGRLATLVAVDAAGDAFYLSPPGLSDLKPLEPVPTEWQLKSFASANATRLQLDPEGGLVPALILEAGGQHYKITGADKDIVTIDPPLASELAAGTRVSKVTAFAPFSGAARNWQAHALYLGDADLLNIEAAASIAVIGATALNAGVAWQYWGKRDPGTEAGWQPLTVAPPDQQTVTGALVLLKPKGAIDQIAIDGRNSRWIRAFRQTITDGGEPLRTDAFSLRINAGGCDNASYKCPPDEATPSPAAEAMANTTPIVLDGSFFPVGKEPRQFDAFYLGSKEAFSKKGAQVRLCFEVADRNFAALGSIRGGPHSDQLLAGVAADERLHLLAFDAANGRLSRFRDREGLSPPSPGPGGAAVSLPPVKLDPKPSFRPAVWSVGSDVFVAVAAGGAVWMWHESTIPLFSGWTWLGELEPGSTSAAAISGLVHLNDGGSGRLFALRDSKLYGRNLNDPNATWARIETKAGAATVSLRTVAPIAVQSTGMSSAYSEGLVGVSAGAKLYAVGFAGAPLAGTCTKLLDNVAPDIAPAAVRRGDGRLVAVGAGTSAKDGKLLGFLSQPSTLAQDKLDEATLRWPKLVGKAIDVNETSGQLTFAACSEINVQATALEAWTPVFDPAKRTVIYTTTIPATGGLAAGAPTLLRQHVVLPTSTSELSVAPFDPLRRMTLSTPPPTTVIRTSGLQEALLPGDSVAIPLTTGTHQLEMVAGAGTDYRGHTYHEFNVESVAGSLFVLKVGATTHTGDIEPAVALDEMVIAGADSDTDTGRLLLIATDASTELYEVIDFDAPTGVALLDRPLTVTDPTLSSVDYNTLLPATALHRPLLSLDPATSGNWDAAILDRTRLVFPDADPELQRGAAFRTDANGHPERVALAEHWVTAPPLTPAGDVEFVVDDSVGEWQRQLGDVSSNPDLSWEYWNGTGWWTLGALDQTLNLKRTGVVQFAVPADARPSDWSGKTNHWIRARLVGGDYGREKVTIKSKPLSGGGTEQIIERSSAGISPPSVVKLHISYAVCADTQPTFVLAEDSGSRRDQSDANRTAGAIVEAFVPLSLMLAGLSKGAAAAHEPGEECPHDCRCRDPKKPEETPKDAELECEEDAAAATSTGGASGARALFIGLAASPSDAPVNVLLLVEETDHTAHAPMTIDALVADRFVPIVAQDATRALGESGILSMSFTITPTPRELFGQTLTWLRLTPAHAAGANWKPVIRGAYLNAVWASATETLTRELLGSSDGGPHQTFRLARPPVLHNTLELRVKEPLGEEEREALGDADPQRVSSTDPSLSGDWVLWKQVADPLDEGPAERVYALDEKTGEVRFGDGLHGAIPPVGRDSIVAFRYQRTESGEPGTLVVPANTIAGRTALNLISPVEGVEAVHAADQAAGGAPPESDDRVLRFGFAQIRHRNRLVTARDIEDLALQSSPEIVQARAFVRRGHVQLIVVMRGENPLPSRAQIRELRRLLLEHGPTALAAPNALRIAGPELKRLRIDLGLRIDTLDHAGPLGEFVKGTVRRFFDSGTGGFDQDGWPLGASPTDEDIAFVLVDAPRLEGLASVSLREIADGIDRPWPGTLKRTELAVLAEDPFRLQFETAEVTA